jgi:hypothetical protein
MDRFAVQKCVGGWRTAVIVTIALLALVAAPALGATVTQAPTVVGDPSPGSELTASTGEWTPASATASYDWLRCSTFGDGCIPIPDSSERTYTVRDADLGHTLRARLTVTEPGQSPATGISGPTGIVAIKPYSIPTGGEGTFTSSGQTAPGTTPAPDTALKVIDPFPVVRISGRFSRSRTRLTRVTVNAPRGARIGVRCRGRGCPYRRRAIAVKLVRVRALQRTYRAGATIEIRVTQPRRIGKYTRVRTRLGKAPLRIDRCLRPGSTRPVRCPTA